MVFFLPIVTKAEVVSIVSYNVVPTVIRELSIQEKVEKEFIDVPKMSSVILCESKFRQFTLNGKTLRSKTSDIGVMQINQVHWKEAESLGLDIWNSVDDNIKMGRIIFQKQGIKAWTCDKLV